MTIQAIVAYPDRIELIADIPMPVLTWGRAFVPLVKGGLGRNTPSRLLCESAHTEENRLIFPRYADRYADDYDLLIARFTVTDPARHDEMIAYTSQLAHVVSSAYIQDDLASSHAGFSAGSFQDMTRVATVDPDLWTDLFLSNAKPLDLALSRLIGRLMQYRDAVNAGDPVMLRRLLQKGREAKESVK